MRIQSDFRKRVGGTKMMNKKFAVSFLIFFIMWVTMGYFLVGVLIEEINSPVMDDELWDVPSERRVRSVLLIPMLFMWLLSLPINTYSLSEKLDTDNSQRGGK